MLSKLSPSLFARGESHDNRRWAAYLKSAAIVGVITCVGLLIGPRQGSTNVAMLYLLGVVFIALRCGLGAALFSAVVSTIVFDYLFVPPILSFATTDIWYLITLVTMISVGVVISVLASAARREALTARERAAHAAALYSFVQSLSDAHDTDQTLRAAAEHIQKDFGRAMAILLSDENDALLLRYQTPDLELDAEAREKARQKFRQAVDGSTRGDRDPFLPLTCGGRAIGIIVLLPANIPLQISSAGERVLEGIACQAAQAIERARLAERAREIDILRKADELRRTLLNSISHSLRAPLAAILSSLDPLADEDVAASSAGTVELARIAQREAHRLDRLVGNLLDLSRLEAGALTLNKEPHEVHNLVAVALKELQNTGERRIESVVQPGLPAVFIDFALMVQVLVNLLENAVKFSPNGLPIHLEARAIDNQVEIRVADRGCGVPAKERETIFRNFSRGTRTEEAPGTGLGLAVSKGFVEAHNGRIWVEERPGGGSVFCFTMPLEAREQDSA